MMKIKKSKKTLLLAALILLFIAAGGAYYYSVQSDRAASEQTTSDPGSPESINFDPPTEEDSKRVEENKQQIAERIEQEKNQPQEPTGSNKTVKPVITYAGQYGQAVEVGAYVDGVFENNGTCTTVFTKNNHKITKSVQAVKNMRSMDCPAMSANTNEFTEKGTWTVVTSYSSSSASGSSETREVEVK